MEENKQPQRFTCVTFNIHGWRTGEPNCDLSFDKVLKTLKEIDADVIALNEVRQSIDIIKPEFRLFTG